MTVKNVCGECKEFKPDELKTEGMFIRRIKVKILEEIDKNREKEFTSDTIKEKLSYYPDEFLSRAWRTLEIEDKIKVSES